mgnify:CR=1 FL=1
MSNTWWPIVRQAVSRFPWFRDSLGVVALVVVALAIIFYATDDPRKELLAAGVLVVVVVISLFLAKPSRGR